MQLRLLISSALLIVTLQACVYRIDIPQGNQIEQEKLAQLKTGMTKSQVEFLLGSAAINDYYHANQAHYVYYQYNGKQKSTELKTMVLSYKDDILMKIDGEL